MLQFIIMIKIANTVEGIVNNDEIARSALGGGYLNLSAFAKSIHDEVEKQTKKSVRIGSIVVALSRMQKRIKQNSSLLPHIIVDDLSVRSGLMEIAFDRTKESIDRLKRLYGDRAFSSADFFTVTQGIGEISIIASEAAEKHIVRVYKGQKPKLQLRGLVGITVRFGGQYIEIPNVTYTFVRGLALKRVNIVEIVSTYTELTFILREKDLQTAFLILNNMFRAREAR
jgi:hypothetical protein